MPKLIKSTNCIMGVYDDDTVFLEAIKKIRGKNFRIKNAMTPFPVHGLEKALGLRESKLGYLAFFFGAIGGTLGFLLMTYAMHISFPLNIGGKPTLPVLSFVPITFELTVLISALGMTIFYLLRNNLLPGFEPKIYHPRATEDRFVLLIEKNNSENAIKKTLEESGAVEIQDEDYLEQNAPVPLPVKMQ